MLTLATGDTLAGVAQQAAEVTCTLYGDEVTVATGVSAFKTLNQQQLPAAAATIYTVGAGLITLVKSIHVVNTDTLNTNSFQLFAGGTAQANAITAVLTLPAGGFAMYAADGWKVFNSSGQFQGLGATGATGPAGAVGAPVGIADQGEQGDPGFGMPSGITNRAALGVDAKNWAFLGTISGTGVTVGPLIWTGQYQQIYFEYIIGGYNGGTPVGRILCGSAAISTTALTNGNRLSENDVTNATSVSVPGCPLAVALSNIARSGNGFIKGASGSLKQIIVEGMSGVPAVATAPADFTGKSFFSDLGTNLLIQRLQLTVYDTLIATAASAQTFTAPTQLWAWGRFND